MKTPSQLQASLVAAAVTALMLTGCGKNNTDERAAGQQSDSVIASAERKIEMAKNDVKQDISDAAITASVNAELIKEPTLSALHINVDTTNGRVALHGTVADAAARDRAARVAASVDGVNGVNNQLVVASPS